MKDKTIRFALCGDSMAVEPMCRSDEHLLQIQELLAGCDVRFTNLEASLHRYESDIYPARYSGGDWVAASPDMLGDLQWLGFNMLGVPNNHSFDWGHNGLVRTLENLEKSGVCFAGIGMNLAQAARPRYLRTARGRVAIISITTTFDDWNLAGEQRRDFIGRPGVFGVGYETIHRVAPHELEALQSIAGTTGMGLAGKIRPDGLFVFEGSLYGTGTPGVETRLMESEMRRLEDSIREAARMADFVLVSCHTHENKDGDDFQNADFQVELAHRSIDAGAHLYAAHGPHVLRGIEVYKNRPIFYSLGNFFYQCSLIDRVPAEFYTKFTACGPTATPADVHDYRDETGVLGETNPDYYQSVIAQCSFSPQGELCAISATPVSLQFKEKRPARGLPQIATGAEGEAIMARLGELCRPYGTDQMLQTIPIKGNR